MTVTHPHEIHCRFFSQEDLLSAGCLDISMAVNAAELAMKAYDDGDVLFPQEIVQVFNDQTHERINCLPATFKSKKICGMKWVSVFPPNPDQYGVQNLSAVIILSETNHGFPIAFMEGTLCSNIRVGAMGAIAAKHLAHPESETIGFIGAGEQAKMHLLAMKSVMPKLRECRVSAKTTSEELAFAKEMQPILPDVDIVSTNGDFKKSIFGSDIIVTATSAQAPLLKASWMKEGSFYSHVGGWEDEYDVAKNCQKIVCDDWETVKLRNQTLSLMYKEGELTDESIYCELIDLVTGRKPGRENEKERVYFNAVGLAYLDVAIAHEMYLRASQAGMGQDLKLQHEMIFEHTNLKNWVRMPEPV